MYVLAENNSTGFTNRWFGQFDTLEEAQQLAENYPAATTIIEYKSYYDMHGKKNGFIPSGRIFNANSSGKVIKEENK